MEIDFTFNFLTVLLTSNQNNLDNNGNKENKAKHKDCNSCNYVKVPHATVKQVIHFRPLMKSLITTTTTKTTNRFTTYLPKEQ